jgi:hypothetical protein
MKLAIKQNMKVIHFQPSTKELSLTQKFIQAMLSKDADAFKSTSRQFLRNNPLYFSGMGIIA